VITFDRQTVVLLSGVGGLLVIASGIGATLKFTVCTESGKLTVANLNARIRAWWIMVVVFTAAIALGPATSCVLFALISFRPCAR
jgi:phosphatidate cytidylyltransferase